MKLRLTYIILIIITAISCNYPIDSKTVLLKNQNKNSSFPYNQNETWTPTRSQLQVTNDIITQLIKENESDFKTYTDNGNYQNYYKQLIPYLSENGDHMIYLNALCSTFVKSPIPYQKVNEKGEIGWESYFYVVDDGGNCFWQAQLNIDKKEYSQLSING